MLDLKPIKARLAMAHGAPWNNTSTVAGDRPVHLQIAVARTGAFGQSAHLTAEQHGQIADFLLNAPQDIAALIAEIERDHFQDEMRHYMRRCEVLEANLKAFTKALEWYANPAHWEEQVDDRGRETLRWRWADDDGRMARHALDCWRVNKEKKDGEKESTNGEANQYHPLQEGNGEAGEAVPAERDVSM